MRILITASTDKAFLSAPMPLARLKCGDACAANDNKALPQARRTVRRYPGNRALSRQA
jgi:hypothetical protein